MGELSKLLYILMKNDLKHDKFDDKGQFFLFLFEALKNYKDLDKIVNIEKIINEINDLAITNNQEFNERIKKILNEAKIS